MFKILTKGCEPKKATKYSAGIDLFSSEDVVIEAGETVNVGLGVCIDEEKIKELIFPMIAPHENREKHIKENKIRFDNFLNSNYIELHPRSSLRAKGLISNTGIIDLDYKDEIKIIIHNPFDGTYDKTYWDDVWKDIPKNYTIKKGDKIAQIMLLEHKGCLFSIESNEERTGGFGSTGE